MREADDALVVDGEHVQPNRLLDRLGGGRLGAEHALEVGESRPVERGDGLQQREQPPRQRGHAGLHQLVERFGHLERPRRSYPPFAGETAGELEREERISA